MSAPSTRTRQAKPSSLTDTADCWMSDVWICPSETLLLASGKVRVSRLQSVKSLSYRLERHAFNTFVSFGSDKPKGQPTRIARRQVIRSRSTNAERAFLARLPPTSTLHNDSHQDPDCLPESKCSLHMHLREKLVYGHNRFEFTYNACQRCPIMVQFRLFHASLPVLITEKRENFVKRLIGVIQYIGECSSLPIFEELFPCNSDSQLRHGKYPRKAVVAGQRFAATNIVSAAE